jgi:hypothetical protein
MSRTTPRSIGDGMSDDLERRVRELEAYRHVASGYINALQSLTITLMMQWILHSKDKRHVLDHIRGFLAAEGARADSPAYDKAAANLMKKLDELTEQNERRKN